MQDVMGSIRNANMYEAVNLNKEENKQLKVTFDKMYYTYSLNV